MKDKQPQSLPAELVRALDGPPGQAHLMGICGVGVAGVARLLAARGWQVSGCDASPDGAMGAWLRQAGVALAEGHDPSHVAPRHPPALFIHTSAVPADHPEIAAARAAGWLVCRRGEALAALVNRSRGVAVCGAHGKTTTTCFTTRLLQELGSRPSWCIGGSTVSLGGVAGAGSEWLVVEADESDGTLAFYEPEVTVVTNVDLDHLEHFDGEQDLVACYRRAVRQTRRGLAYGGDDARACVVAADWKGEAIAFGFGPSCDLRAADERLSANRSTFAVWWRGQCLGEATLGVPGRHNILNALGALAAAILLGHPPCEALARLPLVAELPGRRFQETAHAAGVRVLADYAHHPAEIAALMAMARLQGFSRILAVFQPHRYTRTLALGADFPPAFDGADAVVLAPVYAASEEPLEGGEIADLHAQFRRLRPDRRVLLARSLGEAWNGVRRLLQPGDLLLLVGAGDVARLAEDAAGAVTSGAIGTKSPVCGQSVSIEEAARALTAVDGLTVTLRRSLANTVSYGAGGDADILAEARHPVALAALLHWCEGAGVPCSVLGGGANTWVSDLGVAGVVARLAGAGFRGFVRDGAHVAVGSGWNGPALLDRLETEGLSGLEFLEGVPGQVGGWLAMNAGAHGESIGARVASIECLNRDGSGSIVLPDHAGFGYRRCDGLRERVAWQVRLRLEPVSPEAIRERRQGFRQRRLALAGLRTEGSVFRNPPGDFAGRLLEAAGCKGMRIGGARVFERHANVIVAGAGATGSDVLALTMKMERRVRRVSGVQLTLENRMLGMEW